MARILYLEDEHYLGRIVKESLASRGYEIKLISDGANFMRNFDAFHPDICVLDVMVPNVDGFSLAKSVREKNIDMPIIFLTAKNQTEDVLEGFKSGGNDYIKKPFSMEELIVRVDNLLRLKSIKESDQGGKIFEMGDFVFDQSKFQLKYKEELIELSHRENELLHLLLSQMNQKIERRTILKNIWGDDSLYNSRNLDVYIRKLRVYFERDPRIQLKTLRGVGYYFSFNG